MSTPTLRQASLVYGDSEPPGDDLAELYHEASKLTGIDGADEVAGIKRLLSMPELRVTSTRAVRRHLHARLVELGPSAPLTTPLGEALSRRRSVREFSAAPLALAELAALVRAAHGVTARLGRQDERLTLRSAPSAGALYPLELSVVALNVEGLPSGLYHYDPLDDVLEVVRDERPAVAGTTPFAETAGGAAAVLLLSGMFWRSRFKYGLRGYRFVLLEAGHVAQNALLAATALGLGAVALGGFYDRRADELLGINGVDEATLYLVCIGRPG